MTDRYINSSVLNKPSKISFKISRINYSDGYYRNVGKNKKIPIIIDGIDLFKPNSAGGVGGAIDWINTSDKSIKYINFLVEPYNNVGDVVTGRIRNKTTQWLKGTGPYKAYDKMQRGIWKNIWYNNTVSCIKVVGLEIEFFDNNTVTISDTEKVKQYFYHGTYRSCSYKEQESEHQ